MPEMAPPLQAQGWHGDQTLREGVGTCWAEGLGPDSSPRGKLGIISGGGRSGPGGTPLLSFSIWVVEEGRMTLGPKHPPPLSALHGLTQTLVFLPVLPFFWLRFWASLSPYLHFSIS